MPVPQSQAHNLHYLTMNPRTIRQQGSRTKLKL